MESLVLAVCWCGLGGPGNNQLLIFFGAQSSAMIVFIENKIPKIIDYYINSKWLRPLLTFYYVKMDFFQKNGFLQCKKWLVGATI